MTVTYEPPLSFSGAHHGDSLLREVIWEGPPYARGPRSSRWHRIRSGQRMLHERWQDGSVYLRESYTLWCGQTMFERDRDRYAGAILFADAPPDGEPSCGTCEGRAIGADQSQPRWLFSPARLDAPARCPGSHTSLYREDQGRYNRATCLVCGDVIKLGARGGPYRGTWDARAHEAGPGLIPGCPWHAWRELTLRQHRLRRPGRGLPMPHHPEACVIASTRRDWAVAQQRLRVEEAEKDCSSIFASLHTGDIDVAEAGKLLILAVGAAEDDVRDFDRFIAAGGPDA